MRRKTIIAALAVLIILTSCVASQPKNTQTPEEFRTGNQGLRVTFVPNMPPTRIFDTDEFNAVLEIENLGAYSTKGVADRIYLSGFDPSIITGIKTTGEPIPALEGRGAYIPQGATDRINFKGVPTMLSAKNIDKYPIKLLATACYEYQTIASANICIDPNPYSTTITQKACTPQSISMGGSQGGPIAVTNVQVEASPGRTRLKIDIANNGGGEAFTPGIDSLQRCGPYSSGLEFDEIDTIRLNSVSLPGYSIINSCKPLEQGNIRLINNRATVYCDINTQGQSTYSTPLTVQLSYGYRSVIYKDIQLVSIQ